MKWKFRLENVDAQTKMRAGGNEKGLPNNLAVSFHSHVN
jgi:hypothetical protein